MSVSLLVAFCFSGSVRDWLVGNQSESRQDVFGDGVGGVVRRFVSVPTVRLSGSEETVLLRLSLGMKRVLLVRDSQQQ